MGSPLLKVPGKFWLVPRAKGHKTGTVWFAIQGYHPQLSTIETQKMCTLLKGNETYCLVETELLRTIKGSKRDLNNLLYMRKKSGFRQNVHSKLLTVHVCEFIFIAKMIGFPRRSLPRTATMWLLECCCGGRFGSRG